MKAGHLAILFAWSLLVMVAVGIMLLPLMGNCEGNEACIRNGSRYAGIVIGTGFVIYWAVFIALVRRWNR